MCFAQHAGGFLEASSAAAVCGRRRRSRLWIICAEKNVQWPQLAKVMEFERAAMEVMLSGEPRVVKFTADPFPMLRALAEGRLPEIIPQEGDYEIELKPDGPMTVTGIDMEQIRGAFPFH